VRALLVAVVVLGRTSKSSAPRTVDASVVFASKAGDESVEGRIHCAATRPDEIACSLSHEGDRSLTICFHVEITCMNGNRANAESCRDTAPGTEVRTLHTADACDAIDVGRVTDAWIVKQ
jgi:hypothetical protein